MNTRVEQLIERLHRFDSATLFEAAGQKGMVDPAIRAAWPGARLCGLALTVECPPSDNLMLHHAVATASPGVVIVGKVGGYLAAGAWGEILTAAAQCRAVTGLAVDGAVRDVEAIARRRFSVFSRGLAIGSCTKERFGTLNRPILFGGVVVRPGDVIFGDGDGLVVIEQECLDDVISAAEARHRKEETIIEQLKTGRSTVDLLNLPPLPAEVAGVTRGPKPRRRARR
jgi:4-hydroxy-4-methyl-2-oxoglutarate aldolase